MASKAELKARVSLNSKEFNRGMRNMRRTARRWSRGMAQAANTARRAFSIMAKGLIVGAIGIGLAIKKAFDFETAKEQLAILGGSMEFAEGRFRKLVEFSAKTPFQLPGILEAQKQLINFLGVSNAGVDQIRLIGDAAAAVGKPLEEVAMWYGRAVMAIKSGRPFGRASLRLQQMAILGGEARNMLEKLNAAGASSKDQMAVLNAAFTRFGGGMERLAKTGNGLVSTLKDNLGIALGNLGNQFKGLAKAGLQLTIDKVRDLNEDMSALALLGGTISGSVNNLSEIFRTEFSRMLNLYEGVIDRLKTGLALFFSPAASQLRLLAKVAKVAFDVMRRAGELAFVTLKAASLGAQKTMLIAWQNTINTIINGINRIPSDKIAIEMASFEDLPRISRAFGLAKKEAEGLSAAFHDTPLVQPIIDQMNVILDQNDELWAKWKKNEAISKGMAHFMKEAADIAKQHAAIREFIAKQQQGLLDSALARKKAAEGTADALGDQNDELRKQKPLRGFLGVPIRFLQGRKLRESVEGFKGFSKQPKIAEPKTAMAQTPKPSADVTQNEKDQLTAAQQSAASLQVIERREALAY